MVVSRAACLVDRGVTCNVLAFPDSSMGHALWLVSRSPPHPTIL